MINFVTLKQYCKGDYTKIENYYKALSDTKQMWDIHHRAETDENKSMKQLKEEGRYYNVLPNDLIFLTRYEHNKIHQIDRSTSNETRKKQSIAKIGNKNPMYNKNPLDFMTDEAVQEWKRKRSEIMTGKLAGDKNPAYNKHHYNNGIISILAYECPEGFVAGILKRNKNTIISNK